jgi:phospholipase D1/2
MITPYFRLRRPGPITDKTYRLDGALEAAANRGVRVFVICFMEPKGFVNNDSEHVEELFEALHRNIQVVRHPNGAIPLLWSHHEKMVVIDQRVGFMGGLDICYGRWDTPDHFMFDPSQIWDGCEYNSFRISDIYTPR